MTTEGLPLENHAPSMSTFWQKDTNLITDQYVEPTLMLTKHVLGWQGTASQYKKMKLKMEHQKVTDYLINR
jgi:hypothetical protein